MSSPTIQITAARIEMPMINVKSFFFISDTELLCNQSKLLSHSIRRRTALGFTFSHAGFEADSIVNIIAE